MKEKYLKQIEALEQLKRKEIGQQGAAIKLGLCCRQVRRKLNRFIKEGAEGLIHRSKGRPSKRKFNHELKEKILELMRTKYEGFGPTFAAEKLQERDNITINPETLRKFMIIEGLWQRQRKRKKHKKWRKPREFFGELVQLDGSIHAWVKGEKWTLLKFVDDATKTILWMEFAKAESLEGVATATINYFTKYGMPVSLYTDKGSVFKVNINNNDNEFFTQYQRALSELGCNIIHANSPQAKGRVERSFHTDQDRLVKELKLEGINNIKEANELIKEYYIPKMNNKFAMPAAKKGDLHRSIRNIDLHKHFGIKAIRKVQNDWVISYKTRFFQIDDSRPAIVKPKDDVVVHERLDGSIKISIRSTNLTFKELTERPKYLITKERIFNIKIYRPKPEHPWRNCRVYY